jgi:serine/threonine protein kinase
VGDGATFNVRRTVFHDSRDVVFKSRKFDYEADARKTLMEKLEAILLELRVHTHKPLRHQRNIAQLIQVAWEGDPFDSSIKWPVLVIEYADQGTLKNFLKACGLVDLDIKITLCRDIAEGLAALHSCGVVHGDLKLQNVLIYTEESRHFTAKLSDFGGALLDMPDSCLSPMGTPPWVAPEYGTKRRRSELLLSDVYALGLLFWRMMLDGANPFTLILQRSIDSKEAEKTIQKLKDSDEILPLANESVENYTGYLNKDLFRTLFENTLCLNLFDRHLEKVLTSLRSHAKR